MVSEKDYLDYIDSLEWQKRWISLKQYIYDMSDFTHRRMWMLDISKRMEIYTDMFGQLLKFMEEIERGEKPSSKEILV